MEIKLMHSYGSKDINNYFLDKPEPTDNQIEVETKMTGICRSDIAAYNGWENAMPLGMFGHEGIGIVSKIGKNIKDVEVGDYVATWSDPAYGKYYNANSNQYVKIPEISSKYIMQPVASAINIFDKTLKYMEFLNYIGEPILLIGTGFMSLVIAQLYDNIHVLGNSNKSKWEEIKIKTYSSFKELPQTKYKVIIDLSSKADNYYKISEELGEVEALITYASTPFTPVTTNFFNNNWNCHTFIMPSPRNKDFNSIMKLGVDYIIENKLKTDFLWSESYKAFDLDDMKKAFEDGSIRNDKYLRGYFIF